MPYCRTLILGSLLLLAQSLSAYSLSYDNQSITANTWEEIDIAWDNPFDKNKPNTAQLVRPIRYANKHGLSYGNTNVHMNLAEFGVPDSHVWVTDVKPITQAQIEKIKHLPNNEKPLIGLYQHEVDNVRTYTFSDEQGYTSTIHATPNHPFYVVNLQRYVPIGKISNDMQLVDANGNSISLVCPQGKKVHCGKPYRKGKKTWVYNVEVYQQHRYLVGKQHVLAHNFCETELREITEHLPSRAKEELKLFNHDVYEHEGKIRVDSGYVANEEGTEGSVSFFTADFSPDEWVVHNIERSSLRSFHANDVFREQYLLAAEEGGFRNITPKRFRIYNIVNKETLEHVAGKLPNTSEFSDAFFKNTPLGKYTHHIFNDFKLKPLNIEWSNRTIGGTEYKDLIIDVTDI